MTLRYLAGASYLDLCALFGVVHSTFYNIVWKTLQAIDEYMPALTLELSGLPAKKLVVSCARFCGVARSAIWSKRGRPAHLAKARLWKLDMRLCCFGGLSSRVHDRKGPPWEAPQAECWLLRREPKPPA